MENNDDSNDKKLVNKAKSYNNGPPRIVKNEPIKRKSFDVNEAVRSLDLALGRLKKSKLVNGEYSTVPLDPTKQREMFMDMKSSSHFNAVDNASMMSMNFSHYELMRNLSRSNCNSDGTFSGGTCNAQISSPDSNVKSEHLERFFRSAEMWTRNNGVGPSNVHFEVPEK